MTRMRAQERRTGHGARVEGPASVIDIPPKEFGRVAGEAQELHAPAATAFAEGGGLLEHAAREPVAEGEAGDLGHSAA